MFVTEKSSFSSQEVSHKLKEQFRGIPDEFSTSPLSSQARVSVFPIAYKTRILLSSCVLSWFYDALLSLWAILGASKAFFHKTFV